MKTKKLKYLEVIVALANGMNIECRKKGTTLWYTPSLKGTELSNMVMYEWRLVK